jgi:hypothetical protein
MDREAFAGWQEVQETIQEGAFVTKPRHLHRSLRRRNPDAEMRELERRAAQGDPVARDALIRHRIRAGEVTQLSVEDLVWAGPQALVYLEPGVREKLLGQLMTAMIAFRPGNWFPEHEDPGACPRGHVPGQVVTQGLPVWFQAYFPGEGIRSYTVMESDREPIELDNRYDEALQIDCDEILSCSACNAAWPYDGDYEFV